ncbi:MAG TPA: DUF115 domain-containing protein [Spirochaetes bacterium]|nr:DUF115 domain-containing protein [Spirochaetota bacterium]
MAEFYRRNMELLGRTDPALRGTLENCASDETIRVIESKTGLPVPEAAREGGSLQIHSRYDPVKEAERFIAEADTGKFNLFIVFGFGFGYHIEQLLRTADGDTLVLALERNPAMARKALESRDLTGVFSDRRFVLLIDPVEETIADALRGKSTYRVSFLTHRGSFQLSPDYYTNLRMIAKSYLSTKEVNIATLAKFEKAWSANIARNAREIVSLPGAAGFFGRFDGYPAIVAAAGPSLSRSMDFIKKNAHRAVIVAVDTSYGVLIKNGIVPHFCLSVDPQIVNARYFEGDPGTDCVLIADPTVHPSVFHLYRGRKALTGMAFQMMKWIERITGERGELAYGGSVSTNAWDFARRLGAAPVVMVGQDLAFTGGLAHARGSYLDEQVFLKNGRFSNPLMFNRYQMTVLPPVHVKGIRSEKVHTNHKLMIFLSWFGKRNDPSLINASWDGAFIGGVKHIPAEELDFAERADPRALIDSLYGQSTADGTAWEDRRGALLEECLKMRQELEPLVPALERAVNWSTELVEMMEAENRDGGKLGYLLKRLSDIDALVESKKTLKDMIGFTVQRVIHTITEGYEIDEADGSLPEDMRVARRSLFLYRGLLEGSLFNRKVLSVMDAILRDP